jgi:hypothetical protein
MGAWGTGLFSDDTACDIRDSYRDHLGRGLSGQAAKARILAEYASSFEDPDDSTIAWLSLAATQWQFGRLDAATLENAVEVIDSGSNLQKWEANAADYAKRRVVLEKLRAKITSPQPAEKTVAKRTLESCDWPSGSVVAFQLLSGKWALFRMIDRFTDKGGTYPICELLDWTGSDIPEESLVSSLLPKKSIPGFRSKAAYITQLMLVGLNQKMLKRFHELDIRLKPSKNHHGQTVLNRKNLDSFLKAAFDLE